MFIHHPALSRTAATASIVVAIGALGTLPAAASHGGGVEREGQCTAGSRWKLEANGEDGRIRVDAENDTRMGGQFWTWRILHNGGVSARGKTRTESGSGSLKVERLLVDASGVDTIAWRSTNTVTGEHCNGGLKY